MSLTPEEEHATRNLIQMKDKIEAALQHDRDMTKLLPEIEAMLKERQSKAWAGAILKATAGWITAIAASLIALRGGWDWLVEHIRGPMR